MIIFRTDLEIKLRVLWMELCLRTGKKRPSFQNGQEEDAGNYQPASLTCLPGKVMEWLILEAISIHMDDKKVLSLLSH